jgi:hypothetical protein
MKNYTWYEIGIFTHWSGPSGGRVLCIGAPPKLRSSLCTVAMDSTALDMEFGDPFAMLRPLFDGIITLCDEYTWAVTRMVRAIEQVGLLRWQHIK